MILYISFGTRVTEALPKGPVPDGEMSEWFKEPVLKTGDRASDRGFESHSLRHYFN